jgi:hypothetical protein
LASATEPAQLPPPAPATVPLSVETLDIFVTNLRSQGVKRWAFTGNIEGAPVVLELQFEPAIRSTRPYGDDE